MRAERLRRCGATVSFELAGVRVAVAVFWGVEAGSWGTSTRIRMRGSSSCWGMRKKERRGSIPCYPRRRRGGGRRARRGGVAREGGVQREGKCVQGFAEVPREAVGKAGGGLRPPTAVAVPLSTGDIEAERWEMKSGQICNFQKV